MLVLLVDDNLDHCEALRSPIEAEGHLVMVAYSSREASKLIREHGTSINVAILDYYLGGTMTAEDLAKEIPRGTAIFVVSGHTQRAIRETRPDPFIGVTAFFLKPVEWSSLKPETPGLLQWLERVEKSLEDTQH